MTLTQLKTAVLQEIGVLATGEAPNASDADVMQEKYEALYEMLLTEGLVSWTVTDEIPDYAALPVKLMVAYLCCDPFGVPPAKTVELKRKGALNLSPREGGPSLAERQLRAQTAPRFVYAPVRTDYF